MARISFDGFLDPVRRPRFIIWTCVIVLIIAGVMIPVLGITSTRWFCAESCHKVQDDTITAYQHSSHSEISCMACHVPVNSNPVVFILHKAEALGELYLTVTNKFELPLNAESEVSLTMTPDKCTQCHDVAKRDVTPSRGMKIDHAIHAEKQVSCPICHNRVAHNENFTLELKDPTTGEPNKKHSDFTKMKACFRCHTQGKTTDRPTGECSACHTPAFELKPKSHQAAGFTKAHAKMAAEEDKRVLAAGGSAWLSGKDADYTTPFEGEADAAGEGIGPELPKADAINYCSTCHARSFCTDCHGLPMPHPADFQKGHGKLGNANPKVCAKCHGNATTFCNECHHGASLKWKYQTATPWLKQHPAAVQSVGASACFECHSPTYCANCHVKQAGTTP